VQRREPFPSWGHLVVFNEAAGQSLRKSDGRSSGRAGGVFFMFLVQGHLYKGGQQRLGFGTPTDYVVWAGECS